MHYPNQPKASDIEIVALAFAAEAMQIDSENMLYSTLKTTYSQYCKTLPDRTNFNRRRRFLKPFIDQHDVITLEDITKGG
jgi:hypothetical protein